MRAVCDAGPLIHLSWIDQLRLLRSLFDDVVVPTSVRDEVLAVPTGTLGRDRIEQVFAEGWIRLATPTGATQMDETSLNALGKGELDAIQLARRDSEHILVSDDLVARREAIELGISVTGTIGILVEARERGFAGRVLPLVLELRRLGQWLSDDLVQSVSDQEV